MGNFDHGTTYMRVGGDDAELRPWHYTYAYKRKPKCVESQLCLSRVSLLFSSRHARFAVRIRQFWSGKEPGLIGSVSPNRVRKS